MRPLAAGALYWEAEDTLLVADLHLEKGAAFAALGMLLPPYDTRTTLQRLAEGRSMRSGRAGWSRSATASTGAQSAASLAAEDLALPDRGCRRAASGTGSAAITIRISRLRSAARSAPR